MGFNLQTPVKETLSLNDKESKGLKETHIFTHNDLLDHLPRRYEDRRHFAKFPTNETTQAITLRGLVIDTIKRRLPGRKSFFEVKIQDGSGGIFGTNSVTCRWFNAYYIERMLAVGQEIVLYGKVKKQSGRLIIDHPEFEIVNTTEASIHLERIVPIYPNISGIPQRKLREIIYQLLENLSNDDFTDPAQALAYRHAHFPPSLEKAHKATRFFAKQEFTELQLQVLWRKQQITAQQGIAQGETIELLTKFLETLPFKLTKAQQRSIREIRANMRQTAPMNRLLQGDVGSGKTLVALSAMLLSVESGNQTALMAPTQILAEQHYLTFRRFLEPLGLRIALLTSNRQEQTHLEIEGEPQIIIGTHALLYNKATFSKLSFIVIDEQHKFGVEQRTRLIQQGTRPDVLVMTATPIPRTLTYTIYGDLDVSLLDERPAGRGKLVTALKIKPKISEVTKFLLDQIKQGRQIYLVYALIEDSEKLTAAAATVEYEKWQKRLKGYKVGLLHGRVPPEEKEAIMEQFRIGEIDALVATTVIEVGVDVPNSNVMLIHNAERFGLAQLHQLRGRIGRGEHKSYCILLTDGKSPESQEKLQILAQSNDGFKIAEADLALRGPGDILGTTQSGKRNLRFTSYLSDISLIREARAQAEDILARDPQLKTYPHLTQKLKEEALQENPEITT